MTPYQSEKAKQGQTTNYKALYFPRIRNEGWENFAKCKKYNSVEEIPPSTSGRCVTPYILCSLSKELAVTVKDYKEVSKGYDEKFKWYVDWVKEGIDSALDTFMKVKSGEGNKYMDCEWTAPNSKGSSPCTEVELRVPVGTPKAANRRFITYKMRHEKGFYEALLANHGIEKDWVEW
ncbi:killer toxin alpha beta [Fusarium globosum]|uniref:Killer toxin alpha beta n=1 Tax=Fusarium globosum TaxID=78864 RepID=A0A8H5XV78_9HYPO|nr:killer toxin alpha beta [Fusarium globosum]